MLVRAALVATAFLVPTPISPASMTGLVVISPDAIPEVICPGSDYTSAGSAFRVGPDGLLLSVNHVTSEPNCAIDGKPINIAYASPTEDFSELIGDEGPYLQIDCGGFVEGPQIHRVRPCSRPASDYHGRTHWHGRNR
jgi:hypothetical protein